MKEESGKTGLKINTQKTKIMASGPITSWQINREIMETVRDFIWGVGSKITADCDYSHEIKRFLLLGRKAMTNLDSILKSRDITLSTKVCLVSNNKLLLLLGLGLSGGSVVQNQPAKQERQVWSLYFEDPLEKEIVTHSSIPAWEIPRREEPGSPWGCKELDTT